MIIIYMPQSNTRFFTFSFLTTLRPSLFLLILSITFSSYNHSMASFFSYIFFPLCSRWNGTFSHRRYAIIHFHLQLLHSLCYSPSHSLHLHPCSCSRCISYFSDFFLYHSLFSFIFPHIFFHSITCAEI